MRSFAHLSWLLTALLLAPACGNDDGATSSESSAETNAETNSETNSESSGTASAAEAPLMALGDSGVSGTIRFETVSDGVRLTAEVSGLTPGMNHGFHIHEFGDCSAADGTSAGGHFNPDMNDHGAPGTAMSHAGDFGNLEAGSDGTASYSFVSDKITVGDGGAGDVVGRGVIVHAGSDDLMTQPTGDAGGRIACGVIAMQ